MAILEITQSCEGQPALTALPEIPAKLQRLGRNRNTSIFQ